MAQRVADSIYQDIQRVDPVFLFDLHEARANAENKDFLGSSLIYTDLSEMSDMYLEMLMATESGELCSERFNFYGPGPIREHQQYGDHPAGHPHHHSGDLPGL